MVKRALRLSARSVGCACKLTVKFGHNFGVLLPRRDCSSPGGCPAAGRWLQPLSLTEAGSGALGPVADSIAGQPEARAARRRRAGGESDAGGASDGPPFESWMQRAGEGNRGVQARAAALQSAATTVTSTIVAGGTTSSVPSSHRQVERPTLNGLYSGSGCAQGITMGVYLAGWHIRRSPLVARTLNHRRIVISVLVGHLGPREHASPSRTVDYLITLALSGLS